MPLLGEGTDVWRPVEATLVNGNTYVVGGSMPDDEVWAFTPGTMVQCEMKSFADKSQNLVAVGIAD